jgi:predicted transcriptional regulator
MARLSMFLPDGLKKTLGIFAIRKGVSLTWCVVEAIKDFLRKHGVEIDHD